MFAAQLVASIRFDGLRIRLVEHAKGYVADHWCQKRHVVYFLQGHFVTELVTGENFVITSRIRYVVANKLSLHRSVTLGQPNLSSIATC